MRVRDASPALGAVVDGVDLRRPLTADDAGLLVEAFTRRFLLVFPGQDLTDAEQVEAVAFLGPVAEEARGRVTFVSNHRPDGSLGSSAASFQTRWPVAWLA